jgi:hypothetical protein
VLHPGAQPATAYRLRQLRLQTAAPWVCHMSVSPVFLYKMSCHEVHVYGTRMSIFKDSTGTPVLPSFLFIYSPLDTDQRLKYSTCLKYCVDFLLPHRYSYEQRSPPLNGGRCDPTRPTQCRDYCCERSTAPPSPPPRETCAQYVCPGYAFLQLCTTRLYMCLLFFF